MAMKFLIVGDLHGNKPKIYIEDFDAIIAPGDFCPWSDELREIYNVSYKEFLKDPYNYREWWEIAGKRKAREIITESIQKGREVLEFLGSLEKPVYIVPGNCDWTGDEKSDWNYIKQNLFENYLIKDLDNVINCDGKIVDLEEYQIIGYGKCNGPELFKYRGYDKIFDKKDIKRNEIYYSKLLEKYDMLFRKAITRKKPIIFLSHNVPFNTPLDKITNKDSPRYGYHYGSLVVREMVERYQPLVCIGGHMHEHFGKCRIGRTVCINSGFGSKVNVELELSGNKIKKLKFYRQPKLSRKQ